MEYPFKKDNLDFDKIDSYDDFIKIDKFKIVLKKKYMITNGTTKKKWEGRLKYIMSLLYIFKKKHCIFLWNDKEIKVKYDVNVLKDIKIDNFEYGEFLEWDKNLTLLKLLNTSNSKTILTYINKEDTVVIPKLSVENQSCLQFVNSGVDLINVYALQSKAINVKNKTSVKYINKFLMCCSAHSFKGAIFKYQTDLSNLNKRNFKGCHFYTKIIINTPDTFNDKEFASNVKKFRVCVDISKVFVNGYLPLCFIKYLLDNDIKVSIVLINNCTNEFGSNPKNIDKCKLHKGNIPLYQIFLISKFCKENNIDMVKV